MNRIVIDRKQHWEAVYASKAAEENSWYQPVPRLSLSMIAKTGMGSNASLIDIGAGNSLLVDHLLELGYSDLTVLDLSVAALAQASSRLGSDAPVTWVEADVTSFVPWREFDLWHDRAAFHFLTSASDRERYLAVLRKTLKPKGHAIIATFAPGGPRRCSGLEIVQYDADKLGRELGPEFTLREQHEELHVTPAGGKQLFNFFRFQRHVST